MTSLQLYIMTATGRVPQTPFTFSLAEDTARTTKSPPKSLEFRSTQLIYEGDTCIYRGILIGYDSRQIKAVCKLGLNGDQGTSVLEGYRHEAEAYQTTLSDMQGHCVPLFYGLYTGTVFYDPAVCIILEDCGVSIRSFANLSFDWRAKAVEILMAIHERGLQHNDFCARNVVVDNLQDPQRLVVIDFEHTTPHKCNRKLDIALYQLPPHYEDFGCVELHRVTEKTHVWTPSTVEIFGTWVGVDACGTAEELLAAAPWYKGRYDPEEALLQAEAAICRYFKLWGDREDYVLGKEYKALSPAM